MFKSEEKRYPDLNIGPTATAFCLRIPEAGAQHRLFTAVLGHIAPPIAGAAPRLVPNALV
jgi:hypothetical protein